MNKQALAARLRATFIAELEAQVRAMNADLLALEVAPGDAGRVSSLFRAAHTLKGAARAVGVPVVEQSCHALEALLARVRDGKTALGRAEFALLFGAADGLADAGERLKRDEDLDDSPLAALRDRLTGRSAAVSRPVPAPPAAPRAADRGDDHVRVEVEKLDALVDTAGQLVVTSTRVATRPGELQALHEAASASAAEWARTSRRLRVVLERSGASPQLVRAMTGMEDRLRFLTQESARVAAAAVSDARAVAQVTEEVADNVRRLSTRRFAESCESLPRMVRDLATSAGKDVGLEIVGGEVEVDRAVGERLRDALLHLVRNGVDHGIEPPEVRARAGKTRRGTVRVAATLIGDHVSVAVSDDGAGLDLAAVRRQLEREGRPVPSDERELTAALFEPGFTTRDETTDVSGRGVGLDAVRALVENLRGTVRASFRAGVGTTFTVECPASLATIRALLVSVGNQVLAIPTADVERLIRVPFESVRRVEGRDVVTTGGAPVPVVALASLLPPLTQRPPADPLLVVLLCLADERLAVSVDELMGEQQIVVRPLGKVGTPSPHVSAATILGSGRVALVLNSLSVVTAGLSAAPHPRIGAAARGGAAHAKKRVLVVDDSITTRSLEQSILEAAGYDVVTAVDGAEGWRVLQAQPFDAVVADVEMPRMDGFALCETIRASKRFRDLPVVLVTALELSEHRERGLEVGASAYIGKSSFDQENLLDAIRQLIGIAP